MPLYTEDCGTKSGGAPLMLTANLQTEEKPDYLTGCSLASPSSSCATRGDTEAALRMAW